MPRIRSIHPSFFTHEEVLSCSPLARLLYVGLWTEADDQGIFEWRPLQLKIRLLPIDNCDPAALLTELLNAGLIAPFEHTGTRFGAIRNFRRFQRPKKPNAVHFLPEAWRTYVALGDDSSEPAAAYERRDDDYPALGDAEFGTGGEPPPPSGEKSPQMEDGGEEEGRGKGGEGGARAPERRGSRLSPDWSPGEQDRAYAAKLGFTPAMVERVAERFRNFWVAKPGRNALKLDWSATWRNWVSEEAERRGQKAPSVDAALRSNIQ